MHAASADSSSSSFLERINSDQHELAMRVFMVIVLGSLGRASRAGASRSTCWAGPSPEARGVLGYFYPWLIRSEALHYGYALVMLVGLWLLRKGFTGRLDHFWWMTAFWIQFFHHVEHALLQTAGAHRPQPGGEAGPCNECRPVVGAARRAPSFLQHHRVHSDGDRDGTTILSPPATETEKPRCLCAAHAAGLDIPSGSRGTGIVRPGRHIAATDQTRAVCPGALMRSSQLPAWTCSDGRSSVPCCAGGISARRRSWCCWPWRS